MDAATVIGLAGLAVTGGTALVVITIYASRTRAMAETTATDLTTVKSDLTDKIDANHDTALHKARNVETALSTHIQHTEQVYARKDTLAIELGHIRESQARIEATLSQLVGHP